MFENQKYKLKFVIVLSIFMVFIPISWNLAFKKTIGLIKQDKELNHKLSSLDNASMRIGNLKKRLSYLDEILNTDSFENGAQKYILDKISRICSERDLTIKEMPPSIREIDNEYQVETINIQIAGTFHNLLKLIYDLELKENNINIVSVKFLTEENKRMNTKRLILDLYIQTLKQK